MKYGDYLLKWKEKVKGMRDLNHFCLLKGVGWNVLGNMSRYYQRHPRDSFHPITDFNATKLIKFPFNNHPFCIISLTFIWIISLHPDLSCFLMNIIISVAQRGQ